MRGIAVRAQAFRRHCVHVGNRTDENAEDAMRSVGGVQVMYLVLLGRPGRTGARSRFGMTVQKPPEGIAKSRGDQRLDMPAAVNRPKLGIDAGRAARGFCDRRLVPW